MDITDGMVYPFNIVATWGRRNMTDTEILNLLISKLDRIEDRADINGKKIDKIAIAQAKCDVICEHRKKESEANSAKLLAVSKTIDDLNCAVKEMKLKQDRSDWKVFGKVLLKSAVFITTMSGAGIVLYKLAIFVIALGAP
jgi:hypothetical protein